MRRRTGTVLAFAALSGAMLAGCTPEAPVETTPPPTSAEPTVSEEEALLEEAVAVAERLLVAVDEGFATGEMPRSEMVDFTAAEFIDQLQSEAEVFHAQDVTIEGNSALDSASIIEGQNASSVYLLACQDSSDITTRDSNGEVISGGVERAERVFEFERSGESLVVVNSTVPGDDAEIPGCS